MSVRDALRIINAPLDEHLNEQNRNLDAASQFCVEFFTQKNFEAMDFGEADTLARAKNISVGKIKEIGAVISERGLVRLIKREELEIWDEKDNFSQNYLDKLNKSNCAWLWIQSLVEVFDTDGIQGAAELLAHFEYSENNLKNLAYRLYDICERKHWANEGTFYNELVMAWEDILRATNDFRRKEKEEQINLFKLQGVKIYE